MDARITPVLMAVPAVLVGCVRERCYQDEDCPGDQVCGTDGRCRYPCVQDEGVGPVLTHLRADLECLDHRCRPKPPPVPVTCPDDMVVVADSFCVDRYEASRPDADADHARTVEDRATSRPGVLPWLVPDNATAEAACEAAGKRLCTPAEWETACRGPDQTAYGYGNSYSATTCNGIDAFCHCDPHPHCYPACGADFHVVPTGPFSECTNEWGLLDVNGNVWEAVEAGDGLEHFRGGAYNCGDS